MTIDATFWVMISFFGIIGLLIYFQIPPKIKSTLNENINNIKNQINEAEKLKEDAKNILTDHEKKISNSKTEVKQMISKASEEAEKNTGDKLNETSVKAAVRKKKKKNIGKYL